MGSRIKLRYTRAIINAIHSGELTRAETVTTPIFSLHVRRLPDTASMKLWLHTPSHDIFLEVSGQSFVQHMFQQLSRLTTLRCCQLAASCRCRSTGSAHSMAPWLVELGAGADEDCVKLQVPTTCSGVPAEILNPANQWKNKGEFDVTLGHLADLYQVRKDL